MPTTAVEHRTRTGKHHTRTSSGEKSGKMGHRNVRTKRGKGKGSTPAPTSPPTPRKDLKGKVTQRTAGRRAGRDRTPKPGTTSSTSAVSVQLEKSAPQTTTPKVKMEQLEHPNSRTFQKRLMFNGREYLCTIIKPAGEDTDDETAVWDWANAALRKIKAEAEKTGQESPVMQGEDFTSVWDSSGCVYGTLNEDVVCPADVDAKALVSSNYFKEHYAVRDEATQALATAIRHDKAEEIRSTLRSCPQLEPYTRPAPETTAGTGAVRPVGIPNLGNTCYLATAFGLLARNPVVLANILKHPEAFGDSDGLEGGENHPVYIAFKEFNRLQQPGCTDPASLNLTKLQKALNFPKTQQDAHEALLRLMNCLRPCKRSLLYAEQQTQVGYQKQDSYEIVWTDPKNAPAESMQPQVLVTPPEGGATMESLLTAKPEEIEADRTFTEVDGKQVACTHRRERFVTPPQVLEVHAKRTQRNRKQCSREAKLAIFNDLKKQYNKEQTPGEGVTTLTDEMLTSIFGASNVATFKKADPTEEEKVTLVTHLLENDLCFQAYMSTLASEAKRAIWNAMPEEVVVAPVEVGLTMTLPAGMSKSGKEEKYVLSTFSCHLGGNGSGHYITYFVGKDGKYYQANDQVVTEVTSRGFLDAAKSANVWFYNKEGLTPPQSAESLHKAATAAAEGNQPVKGGVQKVAGTPTTVTVEVGSLAKVGEGYTLVNPTNETVTDFDPDLPTSTRENTETAIKDELSRRTFNKSKFTLSYPEKNLVRPDTKAGTLQTAGVIHVALPDAPNNDQVSSAVTTVLDAARKSGVEKVAMPLMCRKRRTTTQTLRAMKNAIRAYAEKHKKERPFMHEVKIVLKPDQAKQLGLGTVQEAEEQRETPSTETTPAPMAKPAPARKTRTRAPDPLSDADLTADKTKKLHISTRDVQSSTAPKTQKEKVHLAQDILSALPEPKAAAQNVTVDLRPGAVGTGSVHIDPRGYKSSDSGQAHATQEEAIEAFRQALQQYTMDHGEKAGSLNITVVVPTGTNTTRLIWNVNRVRDVLASDHTAISPSGIVSLVETLKGHPVVVEEGAPKVSMATAPTTTKTKAELNSAMEGVFTSQASGITEFIFDLREGQDATASPTQYVANFRPSEYSTDSEGAVQELMKVLPTAQLPDGVTIRVILPKEGLGNNLLHVQEVAKEVQEQAAESSQKREAEAASARASELEEALLEARKSPATKYLESLQLEKETVGFTKAHAMRATASTPPKQATTSSPTNPDITLISKCEVVDCRPGIPTEAVEGVQYVDMNEYGSEMELLGKLLPKLPEDRPVTIILPAKKGVGRRAVDTAYGLAQWGWHRFSRGLRTATNAGLGSEGT